MDVDNKLKAMIVGSAGNSKILLSFNKNHFTLADVPAIKLHIDNSQCDKYLKEIKFKLKRKFKAKTNWSFDHDRSMTIAKNKIKVPETHAKEIFDQELELELH